MAAMGFERVRVLLAKPDTAARRRYLDALFGAGFRTVLDVAELADVADFVGAGRVDLLIVDSALPGGDVCDLVRDVRHTMLGDNPFLVVIALLAVPEAAAVRRLVDAGVDDVVVKPVAPAALVDRIKTLARERKPFVVTRDYIGPDRRQQARDAGQRLPLIEVPNILQSKALSTTDNLTLKRLIDTVAARINAEKADRYVTELEQCVPRLREVYDESGSLVEVVGELNRLERMATDLARRLRGSRYAHVAEVALSLVGICARLAADAAKPHGRDIELLDKVVLVLGRTFAHEAAVVEASLEISARVSDYAQQTRPDPARPAPAPPQAAAACA